MTYALNRWLSTQVRCAAWVELTRARFAAWPRAFDQISKEWLSSVLDGTVVSFDSKILEGGALSDTTLIHNVKFAGAEGKADSLVVKYSKGIEGARGLAMATNSYVNEINFYEQIGENIGVRVPKVYGVFRDEEKPDEWFCLALENMSVEATVQEAIKGVSFEDHKTLLKLAGDMHGRMYGAEETKFDWVDRAGADGSWCEEH